MHKRLEQLIQTNALCAKELVILRSNVEQYLQSNVRLLTMMQNNWSEIERGNDFALMIYENFMSSITNVLDFSRKLNMLMFYSLQDGNKTAGDNLQTACNNQAKKSTNKQICSANLEEKAIKLNGISNEQSNTFLPTEEFCTFPKYHSSADFIYPKLNYRDTYEIGNIYRVYVTNIKDIDNLQFYVLDPNSENVHKVIDISQALDLHQYRTLPPADKVFGLVNDKSIVRAVRSSEVFYNVELKEEIWPCYLLDFGDIVPLKLSDIKYELMDSHKKTPAMALLCQLECKLRVEEMKAKLNDLNYRECFIKIKDIQEDMLIVEITNEEAASNESSLISNEICYSSTSKAVNEKIEKTSKSKPKKQRNTNPFIDESLSECSSNTSFDSELKTITNNVSKPVKEDKKLTPEEMAMLYEEPLCTSNATKAVLGYNRQDEQRICRFYNPATGGCFKGSKCKQEHTPFNPDGWTKGVLPAVSIIEKRSPQVVYPKGTLLNITPTHIGQLGIFYAHINDVQHNNNPLIWNDDDIPPWKHLTTPPHIFELVLCRYEDGLWYRAKILSHDDNYRTFKVFYVDYGNHQTVDIKNLAKCDYALALIPFQAVLCRLAYLKENNVSAEMRNKGIKMLCDDLLNKPVDVKVIAHHEDLIVTLQGELNLNVKSKLVHGGYMKPK